MRHLIWHNIRRLGLWAAVFSLLTGYAVEADETLVPPDPWEIIHSAREFGPAEVGRDTMRDPVITGELDGVPYRIAFYGCWLGRECKTILFQADLGKEDWAPEMKDIDAWNAKALFGRAWMRDDGHAVLDHPVAMADGLPKAALAATFEAWRTALDEYRDFIDF